MRWPLQPLQPLQQTQLQPPFGQSVDSLCHLWFTTNNVPYRFPILKLPPPPCAVLLVIIGLNRAFSISRLLVAISHDVISSLSSLSCPKSCFPVPTEHPSEKKLHQTMRLHGTSTINGGCSQDFPMIFRFRGIKKISNCSSYTVVPFKPHFSSFFPHLFSMKKSHESPPATGFPLFQVAILGSEPRANVSGTSTRASPDGQSTGTKWMWVKMEDLGDHRC